MFPADACSAPQRPLGLFFKPMLDLGFTSAWGSSGQVPELWYVKMMIAAYLTELVFLQ